MNVASSFEGTTILVRMTWGTAFDEEVRATGFGIRFGGGSRSICVDLAFLTLRGLDDTYVSPRTLQQCVQLQILVHLGQGCTTGNVFVNLMSG